MVVQAALMLSGSFSVMLFAGAPISAGIGIASIITAIVSGMDGNTFMLIAAQRYFSDCNSFSLLALPFFLLGDNIMGKGGIAERLVCLARLLVGWVPRYLATTNVLANMSFDVVSGSFAAATSAMGSIMSPLELDEGYDPSYSAAINICPAPIRALIPSSGPLILYFVTASSVSVTTLFMGDCLTGVLLDIATAGLAIFLAVRKGHKASAVKGEDPAWKIVLEAVPSPLAVIIVMGGISTGIFTAVEAGVVMCLYCTLLAIIYREMSIETFHGLLVDTIRSSVMTLFLVAVSSIMSYVMSYSGTPAAISEELISVSNNQYTIILIMNMFLLVMGMFLDLTPAMPISTPIFLLIATNVRMSPVHFRLMPIMNLGIDSITPPVSSCLFAGCGVGRVRIEGVTKYVVPISTAMVIFLFLVSFILAIPLLVPYLCGLMPSMWW